MQDASKASFNAAKACFDDVNICMCYFHVVTNCKKHFNLLPKNSEGLVLEFLKSLHMSTSNAQASNSYSRFVHKNKHLKEFIEKNTFKNVC